MGSRGLLSSSCTFGLKIRALITLLDDRLGWDPKFQLEEGLEKTFEYFENCYLLLVVLG